MRRLYIVSAEPLSWLTGNPNPVGKGLSSIQQAPTNVEIHWVNITCKTKNNHFIDQQKEVFGQGHKYISVQISETEMNRFKMGFSNSCLWPLLHYRLSIFNFQESYYKAYTSVNQKVALKIAKVARPGDLIWVHDYHLMLLPALIKKKKPSVKVGFFLHTPFPSYEVFRNLPKREELILGLLGADLIGFQTYGYLRHFRSSVLRLLRLESEIDTIIHNDHLTRIEVLPIGIIWTEISSALKSRECLSYKQKFRSQYHKKRMVLSVESMKETKGIIHQLHAIERFLTDYPDERETTVFLMIAPTSPGDGKGSLDLQDKVHSIVSQINGKFSSLTNIPLHYMANPVDFNELCALYSLADVALVTPLMDGMNLVAKEYIACTRIGSGMLVLSEFTGAAQELFNSLIVNPNHISEVSNAIHTALNMPESEKKNLMMPMRQKIIQQNASGWFSNFVQYLNKKTSDRYNIPVNNPLTKKNITAFSKAKGIKAVFLDYDGTLREFEKKPDDAVPGKTLLKIFEKISKRADLKIFIVSGRNKEFLVKHMGKYNFTLLAEHGYYVKPPGKNWKHLNQKIDLSWKQKILEIFDFYSRSTPGSTVENKTSTVVWHYRKADPEFGRWKATELMGELTDLISNLPIEIHHGNLIVEVRSVWVGKGPAMQLFTSKVNYTKVLAAGDDQTDETMFQVKHHSLLSIKVGPGETCADYRVTNTAEFLKLLQFL